MEQMATLMSAPYTAFRKNRFFYLWYDGIYAVLIGASIGVMEAVEWVGWFPEASWSLLGLFPVLLYLQIVGHIFVHNATHRSWPRSVNRLVGELCGVWVLTRFASWEIVHQRHHRFSDDPVRDPHPVLPNFWCYAGYTVTNVERQLQQAYYEAFGDTPRHRAYERMRAVVSFAVGMMLLYAWYRFWGPAGFFLAFVPAAALGGLHVIHFNWSTHNGFSKIGDYRPVNLDHGLYWLGNRLFFGIYYHANHHRRPKVFNPMRRHPSLPLEPASVPAASWARRVRSG